MKAAKKKSRRFPPTVVTFEASGAQQFHKFQLAQIQQKVEHSGNLKKEKSEKRQNDDILLYNASQNGQVMLNELDDDVQQEFTEKKEVLLLAEYGDFQVI